eukprot:TRINITY_DN3905_c0_g1_i2.p1 TRINITY_DN3905_c0_g1~~TRINITY_DN3905_c0_g1_i2.p1  ORF type:complete len:103 (-),score=18.26 TRINITY_DN3905_c0_g1_i2:41-349(-)
MNIDYKKKQDKTTQDDKHSSSFIKLSEDEKREYRRLEAVKELLNTETSYVEDLKIVIEVYIQPLKKCLIIDARTIKLIFSNLEMLNNVNKEFAVAFGYLYKE